MTATLVLLRHATTDWNESRLLQGRTDRPLSPAGRREAQGWRLPPNAGIDRDAPWYTSPLRRCLDTAALMGQEPTIEPALIETAWGDWEGQRLVDIRAADPEGVAAREVAGLDFHPPGGESAREVQLRVQGFLSRRATATGAAVAVTHRGVIRAIYAQAVGWDMTCPPPDKLQPACAHIFALKEGGLPSVVALNLPLDTPESVP